MKYVTTIERMAEERGEARGARSREAEIVVNLLRNDMPLEMITKVTGLTIEQIQDLQTQASQ